MVRMPAAAVISALARSLLAGEPAVEDVHARAVRTLGRPWRWLRPLAVALRRGIRRRDSPAPSGRGSVPAERSGVSAAPRRSIAARDLRSRNGWRNRRACNPCRAAQGWRLPAIETVGDLADWLSVSADELEWFADLKGLGNKLRNSEAPALPLRDPPQTLRRRAADRNAEAAIEGIAAPDSVAASWIAIAGPPGGSRLCQRALHRDLRRAPRRQGACCCGSTCRISSPPFRPRGCRLCFGRWAIPKRWPTGWAASAPTRSRDRLERPSGGDRRARMAGRADAVRAAASAARRADVAGARQPDGVPAGLPPRRDWPRPPARCTRATPTTWRSPATRNSPARVERFAAHAAAIALEEGFSVNHHKTRVMRQGVRQQLAGVVVNQKVNLRRRDLELLEAILTNCVRLGPESQNRDEGARISARTWKGESASCEMVNRVGRDERLRRFIARHDSVARTKVRGHGLNRRRRRTGRL